MAFLAKAIEKQKHSHSCSQDFGEQFGMQSAFWIYEAASLAQMCVHRNIAKI